MRMFKSFLSFMVVFVLLAASFAEAYSWSLPVLDSQLQVTSTQDLAVAAGTSNTILASGSCSSGAIYKYYTVVFSPPVLPRGPSRGLMKIYKQTCI